VTSEVLRDNFKFQMQLIKALHKNGFHYPILVFYTFDSVNNTYPVEDESIGDKLKP